MITKVNFKFFYNFVLRYLLINKLNILNSWKNIPNLNKLMMFFSLTNLEDINDVQVYNYVYLFKFFFGLRAFISRLKSSFSLGSWSYSFRVSIIVSKLFVYNNIFFLINDLLPKVDTFYLSTGIYSHNLKILYLLLKDLNVFTEKKTNLGLFSLKKHFNMFLYFEGVDITNIKLFNKNMKLNTF